jgi:hypothetical protein
MCLGMATNSREQHYKVFVLQGPKRKLQEQIPCSFVVTTSDPVWFHWVFKSTVSVALGVPCLAVIVSSTLGWNSFFSTPKHSSWEELDGSAAGPLRPAEAACWKQQQL